MIIEDIKRIMTLPKSQSLISREDVLKRYVTHKKEKVSGTDSQLMICFGYQSDFLSPFIIVDMMLSPFNIATLVGYISKDTFLDLKKEHSLLWSHHSNVDMYQFDYSVMKKHEIKEKMRDIFDDQKQNGQDI